MSERAKFLPVHEVSAKVSEIARDILTERAKHWRVENVQVGVFPELGRVGRKLHGSLLSEIDAGELLEVSVALAERVQDVVGDLRADIVFDGEGCTVGGKLGPDVALGFETFRP